MGIVNDIVDDFPVAPDVATASISSPLCSVESTTPAPHPFTGLVQIPAAQKLFERASRGDPTTTADGEHLLPGMVEAAFGDIIDELARYKVVMTDSATAGVASKGQWDEGVAFQDQLTMRKSEAYYKLMWGKGLHQMYDTLIYYRDQYGDIGDVAIIIAGNDLQWGRDWCVAGLDKVRSLGVTVYSAIPPSSFEKAGEHPNECCPDLYRSPRRRLRFGEHVKRVHAALGCRCTGCCLEAPSASTVSTVATDGHQTRRLHVFHILLCV